MMKEFYKEKLIAKFMDIHVTEFTWNKKKCLIYCDKDGMVDIDDISFFTLDWNIIMDAAKKFNNISISNEMDYMLGEYVKLCDRNDEVIQLYNINAFLGSLIESIEWYNKTMDKQDLIKQTCAASIECKWKYDYFRCSKKTKCVSKERKG